MKRRILETLKMTEISGVDRPCQQGAIVAIMKRAPDARLDAISARVAKLKASVGVINKYSDDQKRDDDGKWTVGGAARAVGRGALRAANHPLGRAALILAGTAATAAAVNRSPRAQAAISRGFAATLRPGEVRPTSRPRTSVPIVRSPRAQMDHDVQQSWDKLSAELRGDKQWMSMVARAERAQGVRTSETPKYMVGGLTQQAANRAKGEALSQTVASVPFMITNAMKQKLRAQGFTPEKIKNMTPKDAHIALSLSKLRGRIDALSKYSDEQKRDDNGRWSLGGTASTLAARGRKTGYKDTGYFDKKKLRTTLAVLRGAGHLASQVVMALVVAHITSKAVNGIVGMVTGRRPPSAPGAYLRGGPGFAHDRIVKPPAPTYGGVSSRGRRGPSAGEIKAIADRAAARSRSMRKAVGLSEAQAQRVLDELPNKLSPADLKAVLEVLSKLDVKKGYNPDEKRDENGRWTFGAGVASAVAHGLGQAAANERAKER